MKPTEITITNEQARRMATVSSAATDDALTKALSTDELNAIHAVGRRLVIDGDATGFAACFGTGDPDDDFSTLELTDDVLRKYLSALDEIATTTATPHHRQACTTVFTHVVDQVDPDAKGLHLQRYQTLDAKSERRVFG